MASTPVEIQDNELEAVRYQLETVGYAEVTLIADGFDDSPAVLATIDGKSLGTTIPCPPSSVVYAEIVGAVYLQDTNGSVDFGESVHVSVCGMRIGTGNVSVMQQQGGDLTVAIVSVEFFSAAGDAAAQLTIASSADTTNQGIDVTFANDAADETGYFVGRAKIVCAKEDKMPKAYLT